MSKLVFIIACILLTTNIIESKVFVFNKNKNNLKLAKPKKSELIILPHESIQATNPDLGLEMEDKSDHLYADFLSDTAYAPIYKAAGKVFGNDFSVALDADSHLNAPVLGSDYTWEPEIETMFTLNNYNLPVGFQTDLKAALKGYWDFMSAAEDFHDDAAPKMTKRIQPNGANVYFSGDYLTGVLDNQIQKFSRLYTQCNIKTTVSQYLSVLNCIRVVTSDELVRTSLTTYQRLYPLIAPELLTGNADIDFEMYVTYLLEVVKAYNDKYNNGHAPIIGNDGNFKNMFGLFPKMKMSVYLQGIGKDNQYYFSVLDRINGIMKLNHHDNSYDAIVTLMKSDVDALAISNYNQRGGNGVFGDNSFLSEIRECSEILNIQWLKRSTTLGDNTVSVTNNLRILKDYLTFDFED